MKMIFLGFIQGFEAFLRLEKGLSEASVEAYLRDVRKWANYLGLEYPDLTLSLADIEAKHIDGFLQFLGRCELSPATQARMLSSLKSFFAYLQVENLCAQDPTALVPMPKQTQYLPEVLSEADLQALFSAIDHSLPEGLRNRAMLELLYACGLRVSELLGLRFSDLYLSAGFLRVIGKGNKERLVPISDQALRHLQYFLDQRKDWKTQNSKAAERLFLNRRGGPLSRVMVFKIVKDLAQRAGLNQNISPHTFRHTFATHLMDGGADLRVIQDLLGHESITTTERYTHLHLQGLRDVLQACHPRHQIGD